MLGKTGAEAGTINALASVFAPLAGPSVPCCLLSFQSSPVGLIVIAQSLTVLIAPLLGVLILVMANKASLMGELRNRWWQNLFGAIGLIAIVASSIRILMRARRTGHCLWKHGSMFNQDLRQPCEMDFRA